MGLKSSSGKAGNRPINFSNDAPGGSGHVTATNSHLVLSSSAGSRTHISGNLEVGGKFIYKPATQNYPTGTTQTIDWDLNQAHYLNLFSASADLALTMSNPQSGGSYLLHVEQADGPFRDIVWSSSSYGVLFAGGTTPTITATSGAIDVFTLYYDGSNYIVTCGQDFK